MGRQPKHKLIPINPDQEKIGKQLAKIRKTRGLTQSQLAEKIGITRSVIADYERGKCRIYDMMLIRLANVLEVTPNNLLCYTNKIQDNTTPSLRLMKRIQKIEQLPVTQQKALLRTIDLALTAMDINE